jgi:soluble lytic murein transglycosylase-like protein
MDSAIKAGTIGLILGAAFWWLQARANYAVTDNYDEQEPIEAPEFDAWAAVDSTIYETIGIDMGGGGFITALNTRGAPYREALAKAEIDNGIPANLLARLAYQESRFRADVISGAKVSSAGAVGIMQIVPRWHPNANPLDPFASIRYAANYLKTLYRQFGTWELALQAYNWGQGNLNKYLKGQINTMPTETANYSSQILADVGVA